MVKIFSKYTFIVIVVLSVVVLIGYYLGVKGFALIDTMSSTKSTNIGDIRFGENILLNPIVYKWEGAVEGKLVSKDGGYFTISDKEGSHFLKLRVDRGTKFYKFYRHQTAEIKLVPLSDVPAGAELSGTFNVFGETHDEIVADNFNYFAD